MSIHNNAVALIQQCLLFICAINMARTIIIFSPRPGYTVDSTLQRALNLLRSSNVEVLAAAQNAGLDNCHTATILLGFVDDKARAIQILARAGISTAG